MSDPLLDPSSLIAYRLAHRTEAAPRRRRTTGQPYAVSPTHRRAVRRASFVVPVALALLGLGLTVLPVSGAR